VFEHGASTKDTVEQFFLTLLRFEFANGEQHAILCFGILEDFAFVIVQQRTPGVPAGHGFRAVVANDDYFYGLGASPGGALVPGGEYLAKTILPGRRWSLWKPWTVQ
jgi:hypothetical protein